MSSRLHNKYHRHNHHTISTVDPRYPDSGHDPIASPDSPFQGPFVLNGTLSASGLPSFSNTISASPAGVFMSYPTALQAIAVSGSNIGTALEVTGDIVGTGSIALQGSISAANVFFTGALFSVYETPIQSTGEFLTINVNGNNRLIRLWNFQ